MSKPPLPEAAVVMLRKPNPAVVTTLRRDGQPVSTATWYLWDDGRVLVNMDEGRKRLEYMRGDPWVALDVLDESDWYTHLSIIGHVDEMREDTGPGRHRPPGPAVHARAVPAARPLPDQRLDRRGRLAWLGCAQGQQPARLSECWCKRSSAAARPLSPRSRRSSHPSRTARYG
jgi:PPOX class probable F420-dependent enzyme